MIAAIRRKLAVAVRSWQAGGFPSHLVTTTPRPQDAVDLFRGEWASKIPLNGVETGHSPLFDDQRLVKLIGNEGIDGARVLELGPLEGGHSYLLEQLGAGSICAIEANARAYLKCLVVKEILEMKRVRFLLGDVYGFLEEDRSDYDLAVAFGIMYHLRNPQRMFELLSPRVVPGGRVMLWTHYWTATIESECATLRGHFSATRTVSLQGGATAELHRHEYGSSIFKKGFFGGNASYSEWMTRQGIIDAATASGFQIEIDEDFQHQNGPSILASFRKI